MTAISHRLKALRKQHGLSLEQLATRAGLTKSYLSKLERGLAEPSISTVLKLAQSYDISVGQLIGEEASLVDDNISVVRVADRSELSDAASVNGHRYQSLAGKRPLRKMEPFVVHPPRAFREPETTSPHDGEELIFVLKGAVEVLLGDRLERLEAGDSIYFDSSLLHRMRTVSRQMAEVLVVTAH